MSEPTCYGRFWGTILGAIFGHLPGAILGFVLGYIFIDQPAAAKAARNADASGGRAGGSAVQRDVSLIQAAASMMAKVAKADGRVSEKEIEVTDSFFKDVLQLDSEGRKTAIEAFRRAKDSPVGIRRYAEQFRTLVGGHEVMCDQMLHILVVLAASDGSIEPAEAIMLAEAAEALRVPEERLKFMLASLVEDFSRYYAILGCSEHDSDETIKERYRLLAKQYHPDVIAGKGLPQDFVDYATRRFQEIQEAYDKIKASRGFR